MTDEKKKFSLLILLSAILTIVSSYLKWTYLFFLFKPLTMVLIILFSRRLYKTSGKYQRFITIGLVLGLIGDIFLMFDHIKSLYFVLGLASFLIGHIFYIIAFLDSKGLLENKVSIIPFGLYGIIAFFVLKDHAGNLLIPIIFYVLALSIMGISSFDRYLSSKNRNTLYVFVGSIFFSASDSCLAFNKFVLPFDLSIFCTLSTYYVAQYLIASSLEDLS
jgi:uncharacterized membrane protein YhhN